MAPNTFPGLSSFWKGSGEHGDCPEQKVSPVGEESRVDVVVCGAYSARQGVVDGDVGRRLAERSEVLRRGR